MAPVLFHCDKCVQSFKNKKAFVFHHKVEHGSVPPGYKDVPILQCDQCPKLFYAKEALADHFRANHTNFSVACPHCQVTFTKRTTLMTHIKTKHLGLTPFRCEEKGCENRTFATKGRLTTHISNVHSRVTCEECGKKCCNPFILKRHLHKVHGILPKGAIECDLCDMFFQTDATLRKHKATKHSI